MFRWTVLTPLAACLPLLAFAVPAAAQTKVGVINLQQAVLGSAEIKKADAEMQARFKPRVDQAQQLQKEINDISQKLQSGQGRLTPQAEAALSAEGTRKQRDLQRLNEDLQGDVDRERNEILSKSSQKMQEVVKKLAEDKGLDLVVEASSALYFKTALDITNDAVAAYDKAYPVAAAAAAVPAAKK
jgi:outer membrane protein